MAKTTAPLFGFAAEGSVGESITFSQWRGVRYAKRYTKPSNPDTVAQQTTRGIFAMLNQFWKLAPAGLVNSWTAFAKGRSFVNRNAFIGQNVKLLRNNGAPVDMADFIASPGSGGAAPATSIAITPGSGELVVSVGQPSVATGWTIAAADAVAFLNQDPTEPFNSVIHYEHETADPSSITITGLTGGEEYVVAVWLVWTKPDGSTAYSISLADTATPTV